MIDFTPQITAFFKENFKPSTLDKATHKLTSQDLLEFLFNVFPKDCIDDYELNTILIGLQYKPFRTMNDDKLSAVWCLEELEKKV